jgi:hypothetical protein
VSYGHSAIPRETALGASSQQQSKEGKLLDAGSQGVMQRSCKEEGDHVPVGLGRHPWSRIFFLFKFRYNQSIQTGVIEEGLPLSGTGACHSYKPTVSTSHSGTLPALSQSCRGPSIATVMPLSVKDLSESPCTQLPCPFSFLQSGKFFLL